MSDQKTDAPGSGSGATGGGGARPPDEQPSQSAGGLSLTRRRFVALMAAALALGAAGMRGLLELLQGPRLPTAGATPTPAGAPPSGGAVPTTPAPPGASAAPTGPGIFSTSPAPIESGPPPGPNRVARENEHRGSRRWELPLDGTGDAQGYMSDVSATEGDRVTLRLDSTIPSLTVAAYRLGWYDGAGARPVARWKDVRVERQPPPMMDPTTGLTRCAWDPALTVTIPSDWTSGLYLFALEPRDGSPQYVPLIVREAAGHAPILFVSSATTFQAYNAWGGKSLYPDESTGAKTVSGGTQAVKVSFERPFNNYRGGGRMMRWEPQFVRWLEAHDHDVAYAADLDLERHPEIVQGRRLLLFQGHPEYFSVGMRATVESAIAAGTNVAWFSANEVYWRVRFEDDGAGRYRSVTCYRYADIDPLAAVDSAHITTKFRESPTKVPESLLIGQMYGHMVLTPSDFVCSTPDHWVFEGTGMQSGDGIADLVGQEYDRYYGDPGFAPPGTTILATSPVLPNYGHLPSVYGPVPPNEPNPPVHNATIYTAPSGATVFSAGTMQWSWALDTWGNQSYEGVHTPVDRRAQRITANVLDRLGR
jgi:hypothetical protein